MCELSLRAERRVFPLLVLLLTTALTASSMHCVRIAGSSAIPDVAGAAALLLTSVMLTVVCYFRAHATPPGGALDWSSHRPDLLHPCATPHVVVDPEMPPAACVPCGTSKPARLHHCSTCRSCVLRFDHHCPWIANCVGLLNAKFFVLFLLYAAVATSTSAALHVLLLMNSYALHAQHVLFVVLAVPFALSVSIVLAGATAALFVWNVRLAWANRTALEHMRISNGKACVAYGADGMQNLRHVFGWNPLLWAIPVRQKRCPPVSTKMCKT